MAEKPNFKVVRQSGEDDTKRTVGRHTTLSAAQVARHKQRAKNREVPEFDSDSITVERIKHRR